jgi:hypothetical protein
MAHGQTRMAIGTRDPAHFLSAVILPLVVWGLQSWLSGLV